MKKKDYGSKVRFLLWAVTVFASIVILQFSYYYIKSLPKAQYHEGESYIPMRAVVTEILNVEDFSYSLDGSSDIKEVTVTFSARLLDDYRKGKTVTAVQSIDGFIPGEPQEEVKPGDKILLLEGYDPTSSYSYTFQDYLRTDILTWLLVIFFVAILIFGHFKGLNTIISLVLTCAAVFCVFIPSVVAFQNVYLWSIITCLYIIIMTLLIVNGYNRKTLVAILGCFSGVMLAGVMTLVLTKILKMSGVLDEQSIYLLNLNSAFNLKGIIFASIIIGAVGAVMDVAMSLAASLHELCIQVEKPTFTLLLKSGFTIGKDMMGTMANTLILAYIGCELPTVILLMAYNKNIIEILNREMIASEIMQGLVGSFGILLSIPFTTLLAAAIFPKMKRPRKAVSSVQDTPESNTLQKGDYSDDNTESGFNGNDGNNENDSDNDKAEN